VSEDHCLNFFHRQQVLADETQKDVLKLLQLNVELTRFLRVSIMLRCSSSPFVYSLPLSGLFGEFLNARVTLPYNKYS
jgi:hypothetical protein